MSLKNRIHLFLIFDLIERKRIIVAIYPWRSISYFELKRSQHNLRQSNNFLIDPRIAIIKFQLIDSFFSRHNISLQLQFLFLILQQLLTTRLTHPKIPQIVQSHSHIIMRNLNQKVKQRIIMQHLKLSLNYLSIRHCNSFSNSHRRKRNQWLFSIPNNITIRHLVIYRSEPLWFLKKKITKFTLTYFPHNPEKQHKFISHRKSHRLVHLVESLNEKVSATMFLVIMEAKKISEYYLHHLLLLCNLQLHFQKNLH